MGFADKMKDLKEKAQSVAAERSDQIQDVVKKAKETADRQTGGKYHDQLGKAEAKADKIVADLKRDGSKSPSEAPPVAGKSAAEQPAPPPASFRD
ncbi:MAG: hypothetical protein NVSMB51_03070 [Solirubrobacteraceae bacterium]